MLVLVMLTIGVATINIIDFYKTGEGESLISNLILMFVVFGVILFLINTMLNKKMLNFALKASYKQGEYKSFLGKYTCDFNDETFKINDVYIKWSDIIKVDTDDAYVFMYNKGFNNTITFPKFPNDLPVDERDKLNQIIQDRFNVNIRL